MVALWRILFGSHDEDLTVFEEDENAESNRTSL